MALKLLTLFSFLLVSCNSQFKKFIPTSGSNFSNLKALIVYNENIEGSSEIANYYSQKRNIHSNRVCAVKAPPSFYANKNEFISIRRQILDCTCRLLSSSDQTQMCSPIDVTKLANTNILNHLVFIRGMPTRLLHDPWPEKAPVDYYLAMSLFHPKVDCAENDCLFQTTGNILSGKPNYSTLSAHYSGLNTTYFTGSVPALNTNEYPYPAFGRIEAVTVDRTKQLIDRTLNAEEQGLTGNWISTDARSNYPSDKITNHLFELSGDYTKQACLSHLATGSAFNSNECRTGFEVEGVPASTGSLYPVVNAGLFFGKVIMQTGNFMQAFRGEMPRMLGWRKSADSCTPLCKDFPTENGKQSCRARSTDYFKELNTDCMGVADGFMGFQLRSYPVGYYGLYPNGWTAPFVGSTMTTPPQTHLSGGIPNQYVSFGDERILSGFNPQCTTLQGDNASCPGYHKMDMQTAYSTANSYHFELEPNGKVKFYVEFYVKSRTTNDFGLTLTSFFQSASNTKNLHVIKTFTVSANNPDWQKYSFEFDSDGFDPNEAYLYNITNLTAEFSGYASFDSVQFKYVKTNLALIDPTTGSFDAPQVTAFSHGDYASVILDRLGAGDRGAVAWWGSSSHHLTSGYAYSETHKTLTALLSGRTLGESLAYTGNGFSGLIYGDPLFSPVAAKLTVQMAMPVSPFSLLIHEARNYLTANPVYPSTQSDSTNFQYTINSASGTIPLNISAMHGRGPANATDWTLEICSKNRLQDCQNNDWTILKTENTAAIEKTLFLDKALIFQKLDSPTASQRLYLRLHIEKSRNNTGQKPLFSYLTLFYTP